MVHAQPLPALPSNLKQRNRQLVLECFMDHRDHTVADIVARTGISKLTVMRAIQFFCAKEILVSSGKGESTEAGGKKPEFFRFAYRKYLLTIRLWPETLGMTLFDMNLNQIRESSLPWILPTSVEVAFRFLREQAETLLKDAGIRLEDLYGVSLSTAGIMEYDSLTLKYSARSPEWGANIPMGQYLKDIFGDGPYYFVENAGKSISRSIVRERPDPSRRILVLFSSWGLSGALAKDGKILNGRDSLIGEIGHIMLDPSDPEPCICGGHGCLERLVSVARLRKQVMACPPPAHSPLSKIPPEEISLRHLFFASRQEDPYAREYVEKLAGFFAMLLRNIAMVFNPEAVFFVGDYAGADDYFEHCIRENLSRCHYLAFSGPIELHYDGRDLPLLDSHGSAIALLEHFFCDPAVYEDEASKEETL